MARRHFAPLLALFAILIASSCALASIVDLDASNFDRVVLDGRGMWLVAFVAPWCGHCQRLEPELEKAAKSLGGVVNVARVNADQERELGARYNVRGFPTVKIFGAGPRNSPAKQKPEDYQGARSAKAIVDYVMYKFNALADPVTVVKSVEQLREIVGTKQPLNAPTAVLFTAKADNPALFKSIALEFDTQNDMKFAVVTNADVKKDVMEAVGVTDSKTLVVVPSTASAAADADILQQRTAYSGQMNKEKLMQFLKSFSPVKAQQKTASSRSTSSDGSARSEAHASGDKASASSHASSPKNHLTVVKSQKDLEEACKKLCVVSLVDTAAADSKQQAFLQQLAAKYGIKRDIIRFLAVDKSAVDVYAFEDAFVRPADEGKDALDLVVIRGQRKKYLRRADLNESNAYDFFDRVLDGFNGLQFSSMENGIPKLLADASSGKDEL